MHSARTPTDRVSQNTPAATSALLAGSLQRLLACGRFGPMTLWFRGGGRVDVWERQSIHLDCDSGTITVVLPAGEQELLLEDLLSIELPPRRAAHAGPTSDRPTS